MKNAIIHEDINEATGYALGTKFTSEKDVREYFTVATQREMFRHDAETDQDKLDAYADRVIESRSHME